MMQSLLDDAPEDCHRHCKCWEDGGECCECEEVHPREAIPVAQLFDGLRDHELDLRAWPPLREHLWPQAGWDSDE